MFKTIRKQPIRHLIVAVICFVAGFLGMRTYTGHYDYQSTLPRK